MTLSFFDILYFFLFNKKFFNYGVYQSGPGNAQSITSQDIGQIMIALEDPAKAIKKHNSRGSDHHNPFPKTGRHLGNQQISQEPVTNQCTHGVPTWEGRN